MTFEVARLEKPFTCSDPDFWGKPSSLTLKPVSRILGNSWFWQPTKNSKEYIIDASLVSTAERRMTLSVGDKKLEVFEHIGVLRFAGLVGLNVVGEGWPPYHGGVGPVWDQIKPLLRDEEVRLPLYTLDNKEGVGWEYPRLTRWGKARTEILPSDDGCLTLEICVDYKGIGFDQAVFRLPNPQQFDEICAARALGWPRPAYYVAHLLRMVRGWPHMNSIAWPQRMSKQKLLHEIMLHRAQDLLGALSLLCDDGIFVGHVKSYCSGHKADIEAVKLAQHGLRRFG